MPENPRIEELRRRVQADPASIAFAALAEEYRRIGRHEDAVEVCRGGLQRHPSYLSARVTLGRALMELGEYDAAKEELETVLGSAPENLAAIRGLAQIHERVGQATEADHSVLQQALDAHAAMTAAKAAAAAPPPPTPPAPVIPFIALAPPAEPAETPDSISLAPAFDVGAPAAPSASSASPFDFDFASFDAAPAGPPPATDAFGFGDADRSLAATPVADPGIARLEHFLAAIASARAELHTR